MKDMQKRKITRNYRLLRRVESWECCHVTAFICPNCGGIQTNAWNISKTKTIFLSREIVKWESFVLFLFMMMNSASQCGLHVFRYIHSNGRYGSARVGVSGPKESDEVGEHRHASGDIGGYPIPQYHKKNWQIPCQKSTKYWYRIYFRSRLL